MWNMNAILHSQVNQRIHLFQSVVWSYHAQLWANLSHKQTKTYQPDSFQELPENYLFWKKRNYWYQTILVAIYLCMCVCWVYGGLVLGSSLPPFSRKLQKIDPWNWKLSRYSFYFSGHILLIPPVENKNPRKQTYDWHYMLNSRGKPSLSRHTFHQVCGKHLLPTADIQRYFPLCWFLNPHIVYQRCIIFSTMLIPQNLGAPMYFPITQFDPWIFDIALVFLRPPLHGNPRRLHCPSKLYSRDSQAHNSIKAL